jgi:transposase
MAGTSVAKRARARRVLARVRSHTREIRELVHELAALVIAYRPALLELPGCGPLTAAKLIAETACAERFHSDAHFARAAGVAPTQRPLSRLEHATRPENTG